MGKENDTQEGMTAGPNAHVPGAVQDLAEADEGGDVVWFPLAQCGQGPFQKQDNEGPAVSWEIPGSMMARHVLFSPHIPTAAG